MKGIRRTWPTKLTNQGSHELIETEQTGVLYQVLSLYVWDATLVFLWDSYLGEQGYLCLFCLLLGFLSSLRMRAFVFLLYFVLSCLTSSLGSLLFSKSETEGE